MTAKSVVEIIDETVEFFTNNPRAVVLGSGGRSVGPVYYDSATGCMCAIGRCLLDPARLAAATARVNKVFGTNKALDDALKPDYRGHSLAFWLELQTLHDSSVFWDSQTLTPAGVSYVQRLRKQHLSPA